MGLHEIPEKNWTISAQHAIKDCTIRQASVKKDRTKQERGAKAERDKT